jgi:hypothetical protein
VGEREGGFESASDTKDCFKVCKSEWRRLRIQIDSWAVKLETMVRMRSWHWACSHQRNWGDVKAWSEELPARLLITEQFSLRRQIQILGL